MHSTVLFAVLTLVAFAGYLPGSNALPRARLLQELYDVPDINQNKQPDLANKLDKLQSLTELQVQEYTQKLCEADKPASPWCEYLKSLKHNSGSEPEIRLNESGEKLQCWPGIPFCKKLHAVRSLRVPPAQNTRRSISSASKCRPGVSNCKPDQRTLAKIYARSVRCIPGWPWCE